MFEDREEYQRRMETVRERGIDALLLTTEVNVRYLASLVDGDWVAPLADDVQAVLVQAGAST